MSEEVSVKKQTIAAFGSLLVMAAIFIVHLFTSFPSYTTIFSIFFMIYLAILYVSRKKLSETFNYLTFLHIMAFAIFLSFTFFDVIILIAIVVVITLILTAAKIFSLHDFAKTIFMLAILFVATTTMIYPSVAISKGQGTVLSDNWWNALNWINNNTEECAVVATYWDPGHFITGIAHRPVVFDGASQNSLWSKIVDANTTYDEMLLIAGTDKFVVINITMDGKEKIKIETARIQDIATSLATENETLAIKILEKYRKPGCGEMYYLATSDLIGKSYWWTYFSSWNPADKGCATPMSQLNLVQAKPSKDGSLALIFQGGIPAGCNRQVGGQVVVVQQNTTLSAFLLSNNQLVPIEKFFYYTNQGGIMKMQPDATAKGLVILEPNKQAIIFVPQEITDSMFTRMFFFNGQGLKNFEYVNSWGGEVKLFKITPG
jgi:dolichyl-diphosphooligosaccharide--protein glycosyltransferase